MDGVLDKARMLRRKRVLKARGRLPEIRERRRHVLSPVADGIIAKKVPPHAVGTLYPGMVANPDEKCDETVLKDGAHNSKIGGRVLLGRLRNAHIVTLALEERATCPRSCTLWEGCYGNNLHLTRRWKHGPELEHALSQEVAELCRKHELVLVRLHVLGDFYSSGYVALWAELLRNHAGLNVFGFTAHMPGTEIGDDIVWMRQQFGLRFAVRHSGSVRAWGSATIDFPTTRKRIGDAIVCPEQLSSNGDGREGVHCGNCCACWSSDVAVLFIEHG